MKEYRKIKNCEKYELQYIDKEKRSKKYELEFIDKEKRNEKYELQFIDKGKREEKYELQFIDSECQKRNPFIEYAFATIGGISRRTKWKLLERFCEEEILTFKEKE